MKGDRYVQYSADQVRKLLIEECGFEEVVLHRTLECVFERETENPCIKIRVYSSIARTSGQGRDVGKDAGRVVLIDQASGKPVWKAKRVYRTKNFLNNLRSRCRDAYKAVSGLPRCPVCKGFMIERKRKGEATPSFYGCLKYPACRGTRPMKKAQRERRERLRKGERDIVVRYKAIDGSRKRRQFSDIGKAQAFARKMVGLAPDINPAFGQAVAPDGIGLVTIEGAPLEEIFPKKES